MAGATTPQPNPVHVVLTGLPSAGSELVLKELSSRHTAICIEDTAFSGLEECPATAPVRFDHWATLRGKGPGVEATLGVPNMENQPDLIVVLMERQNLERHIFFCTTLMDLGRPMLALLKGGETVGRKDLVLHSGAIEERLGFPVIECGTGAADVAESLLAVLPGVVRNPKVPKPIRLPVEIEELLAGLLEVVEVEAKSAGEGGVGQSGLGQSGLSQGGLSQIIGQWPARALLLRTLEGQRSWGQRLTASIPGLVGRLEKGMAEYASGAGRGVSVAVAEARYAYAAGLVRESVDLQDLRTRVALSDRLDSILLHPVVGIPLFFLVMYGVFWFTFRVGEWPVAGLEWLFGHLSAAATFWWPHEWPSWTRSLIVDGILGGVGGVTVFVPNIFILYFCISLMETSGYMARSMFLVDGLMHRLGLRGRSFLPMILGLGCSVPAMMATRTIDNRHDRLATLLAIPLIPCGARLPVFMLLIPAFFPPPWRGTMLFVVYGVGILLAFLVSLLLRRVLFPERAAAFVMELPPYRLPTLRRLFQPAWLNTLMYLRKAGTVILLFSVGLWMAAHFPQLPSQERIRAVAQLPEGASEDLVEQQVEAAQLQHSVLGALGRGLEPVFSPLGFDWRIATAALGAIAAKEVFVAQLGVVFSMETGADPRRLGEVLSETYPRSTGVAILFFMLLTFPCVSSMVTTYRESGSWKYVVLQVVLLLALAYVVALVMKVVLAALGI